MPDSSDLLRFRVAIVQQRSNVLVHKAGSGPAKVTAKVSLQQHTGTIGVLSQLRAFRTRSKPNGSGRGHVLAVYSSNDGRQRHQYWNIQR